MTAFQYRGLELVPDDLTYPGWLPAMSEAGLNLLVIHIPRQMGALVEYASSAEYESLARDAEARGIEIEWAPHALSDLLPRDEFAAHPDWFRMDLLGRRLPDWNLCPSSPGALDTVRRNAAVISRRLVPTTHRYYLWADDGRPWCHCPKCAGLNDSDQNMIVTNTILEAIRTTDPQAQLSGIAYIQTLQPLQHVRPAEGVFLEYAPIRRCYLHALDDPDCSVNRLELAQLRALLPGYPMAGSQVLEYWLDESLFWRTAGRPEVPPRLPFSPSVLERDLELYAGLGFNSVLSYGVMAGENYIAHHGRPPIAEFGAALQRVGGRGG